MCSILSRLDWESPGVRDRSLGTLTTVPGMKGAQNSVVRVCFGGGRTSGRDMEGLQGSHRLNLADRGKFLDEESFGP